MKILENYPDISFIEDLTLEEMQEAMLEDYREKYEEITGQRLTLAKADPTRLILYAATLQLYQGMQYIDRAAKQSFLKYSYGDFLENLGALKGIVRNPGEAARVMVRFALSEARTETVTIPAGTRATPGGNVYFLTQEEYAIPVGEAYGDVEMVCAELGDIGNDFEPGSIRTLVDKIPYMGSIANINTSSGGAEAESDENLAERIYLAPSAYSVAGPDDAYRYWVKTFNPSISDVHVWSPVPGEVDIRFIVGDGEIPDEALVQAVEDYLMEGDRRPLTDHVTVGVPEVYPFRVNLKYWVNESEKNKAAAIQHNVDEAVRGFAYWQKTQIGRDINPSYLSYLMIQAGAKRVEITEPVFTAVGDTGLAIMEEAAVIFGGVERD